MIMVSFRITKTRVLAGVAALAILIGGGTMVKNYITGGSIFASKASTTAQATAKTNEDRMDFIGMFGWEVAEEPIEVLEVLIPDKFDDVYENYNDLQKLQGYDLSKYTGKRAKRYTYEVTNYPGDMGTVHINLLVYKNKIIGGDVSSADLDGFMHGFDIKTATTLNTTGEVPTSGVGEDLERLGDDIRDDVREGVDDVLDGDREPVTVYDDDLPNPDMGAAFEEIPTTAMEDDIAAEELAERDGTMDGDLMNDGVDGMDRTDDTIENDNTANPGTGAGELPIAFLG